MKKKLTALILSTVLMFTLFGCGGSVSADKAMSIAQEYTGVDRTLTEALSASGPLTDAAGNEIIVVDFTNDDVNYLCRVDAKSGHVMGVCRESKFSAEGRNCTLAQAKDAALEDAGFNEVDVVFTKARSCWDDGVHHFEVEFISDEREYEYEISSTDLAIIEKDIDSVEKLTAKDGSITEDEAKDIALKHAGFTKDDVFFTKSRLDYDDGIMVYDIEFCKDRIEYEYEIDCTTGAVISVETDDDDGRFYYASNEGNGSGNGSGTGNGVQQQIQKQDGTGTGAGTGYGNGASTGHHNNQHHDLISKDAAVEIALNHAGLKLSDVTLEKAVLDYDDGIAAYEIDFYAGEYEYDYEVHAKSGKILEASKERDDDIIISTPPAGVGSGSGNGNGSGSGSGSGSGNGNGNSNSGSSGISLEEAKSIALSNAGFSASEVVFETAKKDYDDGVAVYEIEFYKDRVEYSYEISMSGKILDKDVDRD